MGRCGRYKERGEGGSVASYYMSIQVQVLEVFHWTDTPPGTYQVSIMCCFCGKKHHHGAGKLVDGVLPPDSLGTRVPHCDERLCSAEYELRLEAWHATKKQVIVKNP